MREIEEKILAELEEIEEISSQQLVYIQANDWTFEPVRSIRINFHETHKELTERNMDIAKKLNDLVKGDHSHPRIKKAFDMLDKFLKLYSKRYEKYKTSEKWSEYKIGEPGVKDDTDIKSEMLFQSEIFKNLQKFKAIMNKVLSSEVSDSIDLDIYKDTVLPIGFRTMANELYPEIEEFIQKRRDKESLNTTKKTKRGKIKNNTEGLPGGNGSDMP